MSLHPTLAAWLAEHGFADVHTPGQHGNTPLMYAASSGRTDVLKLLLALGANPRLSTQDDFSALDMAANLECLTLLRSAARAAA